MLLKIFPHCSFSVPQVISLLHPQQESKAVADKFTDFKSQLGRMVSLTEIPREGSNDFVDQIDADLKDREAKQAAEGWAIVPSPESALALQRTRFARQ